MILDAALEVLGEVGYEGMTMDMVATRAKAGTATVYRRWTSKPELVLDAIARMKRVQVDLDHLPDTGSLRGVLVALAKQEPAEDAERRLKVMGGSRRWRRTTSARPAAPRSSNRGSRPTGC